MSKKIQSRKEIKLLVDSFYEKVRKDDLLADIFEDVIQDQWPQHLEKMYRFWQTVLLEEHTYYGSPFRAHEHLPVSKPHFDRWMKLFNQTVEELFVGKKAKEAQWRAERMADMFRSKIEYNKKNSSKSLI